MKSIYGGYTRLDTNGNAYFAGANTADGFKGLYGRIADERKMERVYVIKGGPGTGKSTLIRKAVDAAAKEGFTAELYFCGSDPESLDGAVLDGRIVLLDGTSPHIRDMNYPGASSSLIDLSKFWDSGVLEGARNEIITRCTAKSACWDSAYRWMRASDTVNEERMSQAECCFDREKASAYVGRLLKQLGKPASGESGYTEVRCTRAVTMRGRFYLPTFENLAEAVYAVSDMYDCAAPFMELLAGRLAAAGYDTVVSRLPVTGYADGIFLPSRKVAVVTSNPEAEHRTIHMTRFVYDEIPQEVRGQIRLAAKVEESCMTEALACLSRAADEHFALEEIYRQAMDFSALGRYGRKVCAEILERLKK